MNLLQRIASLLKANLSDLLSRAEDPEKVLTQAIEDMRKQLLEAKSRVALAIADERRLAKQHETAVQAAEEWEKKAMAAVRAGRDDLAVQALAKKKEQEAIALQLEQQLKDQQAAVDELKKALTALSAKIEEAARKRAVLVARVKRAEAQKAIAETMAAASDRSAFETFDRMTEKVDRIEAEAGAQMEVAALGTGAQDAELSEKIRLLEAAPVDDELADLKRKMGLLGAGNQGALPAGDGNVELAESSGSSKA
jgi:phage shock protein A